MRLCYECLKRQPLSEFGKNSGMADGYLRQCKSCRREWTRGYREENRDTIRAKQARWEQLPESKAKAKARLNQWAIDNPERKRAMTIVGNAVRDGKLIPQLCWVCGKKAEAHHPDYSRPLDVAWLCHLHHLQAHRAHLAA
jgi:hypothetical protein